MIVVFLILLRVKIGRGVGDVTNCNGSIILAVFLSVVVNIASIVDVCDCKSLT